MTKTSPWPKSPKKTNKKLWGHLPQFKQNDIYWHSLEFQESINPRGSTESWSHNQKCSKQGFAFKTSQAPLQSTHLNSKSIHHITESRTCLLKNAYLKLNLNQSSKTCVHPVGRTWHFVFQSSHSCTYQINNVRNSWLNICPKARQSHIRHQNLKGCLCPSGRSSKQLFKSMKNTKYYFIYRHIM